MQGVYRHVRNPMISGVLFVLLGESVLTASLPLFWWFLLFAFVNATYIPLLEEPGLVKRFGEDYLDLQTERAEMGSEVDAVGRWGERRLLNGARQRNVGAVRPIEGRPSRRSITSSTERVQSCGR